MQLKSYKESIVWKKSIELVKAIYLITKQMPKSELYVLVTQILRAAISIPSNIAEGWSRNHKLEFARFLSIAYASAAELETQLIIAKVQYPNIDYKNAEDLQSEIQKILFTLIRNTKAVPAKW